MLSLLLVSNVDALFQSKWLQMDVCNEIVRRGNLPIQQKLCNKQWLGQKFQFFL